ncbi:MAG TPA: phosphoenolpyruvate carboxykinase [Trueperaceae bacterium]
MVDYMERTGTGLESYLERAEAVHWQLSVPALVEEAIRRGEGILAKDGPLVVDTGRYTGRSPGDKFIVKDETTERGVDWGDINQAMDAEHYSALKADMLDALRGKELYVQDLYVGTDPNYRVAVRVITEYAWHSLFARNLFVLPETPPAEPSYTVLDLPSFRADPERHGTRSETVIAMNLSDRLVLVGNTEYAGEIKKSIFSAMNFELPEKNVMPMHCSANEGEDGRTALYFGLSGTGKTTLSADASRTLIGDDEHGWSEAGVFNFEGGCYAKVINLRPEAEPEIYATTERFGTILENVVLDSDSREVDFADSRKTENTRAAYPIDFIPNASRTGMGGHPTNVVLLTADAFGVLPPISRLTVPQAMYHFLSGYTAKVAGTERGVSEPRATFSACFGAPFMPRDPATYALMLGEKLRQHGSAVWLVNTGWSGGPYGTGERIDLAYTRTMVKAALAGKLDDAPTRVHPVFGLAMITRCPGVPGELLSPKETWDDPQAYDAQAAKLANMFKENFRQFEANLPDEVRKAGPR